MREDTWELYNSAIAPSRWCKRGKGLSHAPTTVVMELEIVVDNPPDARSTPPACRPLPGKHPVVAAGEREVS